MAHFHFENFPWPYSQSIAQELDPNFHQSLKRFFRPKTGDLKTKKKGLHQNSNGFSGRKQVISKKKTPPKFDRFLRPKTGDLQKKKKTNSTRHSQQLSASFLTLSGNKQLIVQIRLFQTKMFCGPLQNTSVAHRWAMAHRLKTTALEVESRTQGSRPRAQKNPRTRTALPRTTLSRPRTEMLETKITCASVLQKKCLQKFFSGDLQKRKTKQIFANFPRSFWRFPTKFYRFKK